MLCEKCNIEHDGHYGSGRFCSKFCAFSFGANQNRAERNKKTSISLHQSALGNRPIKFCMKCKRHFPKPIGWKRRRCPDCPSSKIDLVSFDCLGGNEARKNRLFKEFGRMCWKCKREEWEGEKIPLELHHINGNKNDGSKENCSILCANCHALTDNYKGRHKKY